MRIHEKYVNETLDKHGNVSKVTFNVPDDFNYAYDVIDEIARQSPTRRAMLWTNDKGAEKTFTFADIKEQSDKYASYFLSIGIKKGDNVMVLLKRHYEYWLTAMALCKIGAVIIPATIQLQVKDLIYRFEAADVTAIIVTQDDDIADLADEAYAKSAVKPLRISVRKKRQDWLFLDEGAEAAPPFVKPAKADLPMAHDLMLIYFTSGTTGFPKMVAQNHDYPIGHIPTAKYWHKVDPDGLHITVADTGWAKASWGKLYGQWFMEAGLFVYDHDRFHPDEMLSMLERHKVTTFCAPPTLYRFLIHEDLTKYDLSSIKHATVAGEALNAEVFDQFKKATGLEIMEGFGQSETTVAVCTTYWMKPRPGSMGRPCPSYDMEIVDPEGKPVDDGVVGEIVFKVGEGHNIVGLFEGYIKDDEKTASIWCDGLYHTGDMAWRDEEGYYWYEGRVDDLIKSSGYRIGPFEVESVLMTHPAVVECAVTGVPDPVRTQVVKATIVLAKGFTASDELAKEIQNYVKTNTAPYKYPRIVEFVEQLPKTFSGKIKRADIRKSDEA